MQQAIHIICKTARLITAHLSRPLGYPVSTPVSTYLARLFERGEEPLLALARGAVGAAEHADVPAHSAMNAYPCVPREYPLSTHGVLLEYPYGGPSSTPRDPGEYPESTQ